MIKIDEEQMKEFLQIGVHEQIDSKYSDMTISESYSHLRNCVDVTLYDLKIIIDDTYYIEFDSYKFDEVKVSNLVKSRHLDSDYIEENIEDIKDYMELNEIDRVLNNL